MFVLFNLKKNGYLFKCNVLFIIYVVDTIFLGANDIIKQFKKYIYYFGFHFRFGYIFVFCSNSIRHVNLGTQLSI